MKLFRLREKARRKGFIIEEVQGEGFLLSNLSSKKPKEIKCHSLDEVQKKLKGQL